MHTSLNTKFVPKRRSSRDVFYKPEPPSLSNPTVYTSGPHNALHLPRKLIYSNSHNNWRGHLQSLLCVWASGSLLSSSTSALKSWSIHRKPPITKDA
ncbi:hypothetical protein V1264_006168 [Littorina saxatilis]|uniref:Uncharacterized protein n=1 Tax=Littorina saxatilis TaxID=31220 RepID=A0AAN9AWX0_9CAEN